MSPALLINIVALIAAAGSAGWFAVQWWRARRVALTANAGVATAAATLASLPGGD